MFEIMTFEIASDMASKTIPLLQNLTIFGRKGGGGGLAGNVGALCCNNPLFKENYLVQNGHVQYMLSI